MSVSYADVWARIAVEFPERIAVVSDRHEISYREFDSAAGRFAQFLADRGIGPGERIALYLYNRPEYLVVVYGALRLGAVPVPMNFRYGASELADLLDDSQARALIFPASLSNVLREASQFGGLPELMVQIDDGTETGLDDAVLYPQPRDQESSHTVTEAQTAELMLYTGGTTGRPKGVIWDAADLFAVQQEPTYGPLGIAVPQTMEERVEAAGTAPESVTMPLAPLMHATALFNAMNTLTLGGKVVILPTARFDPVMAVRVAAEQRVTGMIIAGDAVAVPLLDAAEDTRQRKLGTLHTVLSSGMRFSDEVKRRLHQLGQITVFDILASTEGGPYAVAITRRAEEVPGALRLTAEAVVLDEEDREIQDQVGAVGVLGYRGSMPRGYLHGEPPNTARPVFRTTAGGTQYVVPGDYVRVLPDRCIELLGRGSAVVNTGGEKVYPVEVEEALTSHPDVTDAVVVGLPDPRWGESVAAVVAVREGTAVTAEELQGHVGRNLASFKKPRTVRIQSALERSPTGKINLARLRTELLADFQQPL